MQKNNIQKIRTIKKKKPANFKYEIGDKFKNKNNAFKITGTAKVLADVHTGRTGDCYLLQITKSSGKKVNYSASAPAWKLEKDIKDFNYIRG